MQERKEIVIAIDPDLARSGYCALFSFNGTFESDNLPFYELVERIAHWKGYAEQNGLKISVFVEGGWLNEKSNFHPAQGRRAEKIAHDVGQNHAVGKLILEWCQHIHVYSCAVKPLRKCWKGKDRKITKEELEGVVGRKLNRCNQDERDAILLAWACAGMPW